MFFLLRMAFWLGLVLLLLPISTSEDGSRQIGAWQALSAAQSALSDISGFCDRQPQACAVGGQLLAHVGDKAQAAAGWLLENVGNSGNGDATHALTPQDLAPSWGGEAVNAGAPVAAPKAAEPALAPLSLPPAGVPLPPRRPA